MEQLAMLALASMFTMLLGLLVGKITAEGKVTVLAESMAKLADSVSELDKKLISFLEKHNNTTEDVAECKSNDLELFDRMRKCEARQQVIEYKVGDLADAHKECEHRRKGKI